MSYLDRVREVSEHDATGLLPFRVAGVTVGWVYPDAARRLCGAGDAFRLGTAELRLADHLDRPDTTPEARTEAVDEIMRALAVGGTVPGWRGERYPLPPAHRGAALLEIERAALPLLGGCACGVHLNGYVRGANGIEMWLGRRAANKSTWPGCLDQLVAGGQPAGLGLRENLAKECWEEAGIEPELAAQAVAIGTISYVYGTEHGLRPDVLFNFDLELPHDFVPENRDGEMAGFERWPLERVAATVRDTTAFKFNCAVVAIDFLVRHGFIEPDHPDYVDIVAGMHTSSPYHSCC